MWLVRIGVGTLLLWLRIGSPSQGQPQVHQSSVSPYASLRYDENYAALRDPAKRTQALDGLKFIGLNRAQTTYLTLGGEVRLRGQYYHNQGWGAAPSVNNGNLVQRYLFFADVHMGRYVRTFGQLNSSLQNFRKGGPDVLEVDPLYVQQAFVDLTLPLPDSSSLRLRAGRQEFYYGNGKLVALRDGPNTALTFDAVRAVVQGRTTGRADVFVAQPVQNNPGLLDNRRDRNQTFWGVYVTGPIDRLIPKATLDVYYLGIRNDSIRFDQGTGREVRHTVGIRFSRVTANLNYGLEYLYQTGTFVGSPIRAWGLTGGVGYTVRSGVRSVRVALGGGLGSGDHDPQNPNLGTLNSLYATGFYFGPPVVPIGPANVATLWPSLTMKPSPSVTVGLSASVVWRQSTNDGLYTPGSAALFLPRGESNARYVGTQVNLTADWQLQRYLDLTLWAVFYPPGTYLRSVTPGQALVYVAPQATFRF